MVDHVDDNDGAEPPVSWFNDERVVKVRKERQELLSSVASHDYSSIRKRVASILNLYPQTRNSDIELSLRYWETFDREYYNPQGIAPRDLFKMERMTNLTRARAQIQNDYGLFLSDPEVRNRRKKNEEEIQENVGAEASPRPVVSVFTDETGKNADQVIIGSVWVLNGRSVYELSRSIDNWKKGSGFEGREVHFKRFRAGDEEPIQGYIDTILEHRQYLSFKAIAIERAQTRRHINELICRLHETMLVEGARHELEHRRFDLPRAIELTIDDEESLDAIALRDIRMKASQELGMDTGNQLIVDMVEKVESHRSNMVQLADVVAGALNRRLNASGNERNHKDTIADMVCDAFGLDLDRRDIENVDAAVLMRI